MAEITFDELPLVVDESEVVSFKGTYCYTDMEIKWRRVVDLWEKDFDFHFEAFNIAYAAHIAFSDFCRSKFPNIDDDVITKFIMGVGADIYHSDEILRTLASLAVELGVNADILKPGNFSDVETRLRESQAGRQWLKELETHKDPWFYFSTGVSIISPRDRSWIEDMDVPLGILRNYIERLERSEEIEQNKAAVSAESDRIFGEYRDLLDEGDKAQFDQLRALDRNTSPHIEGHMFGLSACTITRLGGF
jgi:pyruvate,water dikinase